MAVAPSESSETEKSLYHVAGIELSSGLSLHPGGLTIAIGPNNGGKSRFLRDLVSAIATPNTPRTAIRSIEPRFPCGIDALFEMAIQDANLDASGQLILDAPSSDYQQPMQLRIFAQEMGRPLTPAQKEWNVRNNLGRLLIGHLTTESRLLLVKRQINRQLNIDGPQSALEAAFSATQDTMEWVNDRLQIAFGTGVILDNTLFARAEFRLGDEKMLPSEREERRKRLQTLPPLDEQGDGIRSYVGILVAVSAFKRPVIAVDEPEAFLHPPQAFQMGQALAECRNRGAQLFVATHSAEVLRGILSVTTDVTVVRFSRARDKFVTKALDPERLQEIASDPLLSSARVLDGLFYSGVIITESDADVVLYRAVLEQIDSSASLSFTNSYGKSQSARMAAPFLAMDVPCAILVDVDALRDRDDLKHLYESLGGHWPDLRSEYDGMIEAIEASDDSVNRLETAVSNLHRATEDAIRGGDARKRLKSLRRDLAGIRERASVWAQLKERGIDCLPDEARQRCERVIAACERLGLFVSRTGEREAWLRPDVAYSRNKRRWTGDALRFLAAQAPLRADHPLRTYVASVREHCRGR